MSDFVTIAEAAKRLRVLAGEINQVHARVTLEVHVLAKQGLE